MANLPGMTVSANSSTPRAAAEQARVLTSRQRTWRWFAVVGALLLLISAVSTISSGFSQMGSSAAHSLFSFAGNPFVGLAVGVLATVVIQSSTTVTAITVTAVGTGALTVGESIPIILGSNVGTTVTCTFVALGFVGDTEEFRRALTASTIHDFFNLLALAIFFPLELIFHPLERTSGWMANLLYGTSTTPDPSSFNPIRAVTRPLVTAIGETIGQVGSAKVGGILVCVTGVAMIFFAVRILSTLLKTLMQGRAQTLLLTAVGEGTGRAMLTGLGVTLVTQSSTVTNSVLVPFVGAGAITPRQVYPVTLGGNLGTTFTSLLAALAVTGKQAKFGLQAALVHVVYNVFAIALIWGVPFLRPLPLKAATWLAGRAAENKRFLAAYLIGVFILLPLSVIGLSLVF